MSSDMLNMTLGEKGPLRQIHAQWDHYLVLASIAISLLGSFTACQLVCQARASLHFPAIFAWSLLGSLIFGFCSIWALHEVAMLAFEFDLPMDVDPVWTLISALVAVFFTFCAMTGNLLYTKWRSNRSGQRSRNLDRDRRRRSVRNHLYHENANTSQTALLTMPSNEDESHHRYDAEDASRGDEERQWLPPDGVEVTNKLSVAPFSSTTSISAPTSIVPLGSNRSRDGNLDVPPTEASDDEFRSYSAASETSSYRRHSTNESTSSFGLRNAIGLARPHPTADRSNIFRTTITLLYVGLTIGNIARGFTWSIAVFAMHYTGIWSLRIPHGYYLFSPGYVLLSAIICWIVCTVGLILMSNMETDLPQQILFSVVATSGVASMHWCGMRATTFWTTQPASERRGFPPALSGSIIAIAFLTCMIANVMLSHSATLSRNKLAEIVWTRRQLFKNIAAKEHAEAAARARSEFIASASHEIRTPLHHLQGYSDLLSHTELTEEGRTLLIAIQRATKTLSLLTNNVLDWSKFEGNASGQYLPTPVDIRVVCESMMTLLPNLEDESRVEVYVVVSPNVPKTLSLDESWIHRILMNLVSNALKFTKNGYILVVLEYADDDLIASISDTGCGLSPEFIPDMWTPFKQGEVRGSARGTGLGLSIVQMLLHRMSGSIEVESQFEQTEGVGPGHSGTKFIATIPVGAMQLTSTQDPEESEDSLATCSQINNTQMSERPKVAIMSGQGRSLEGLRFAWQSFGYDVLPFESVDELIECPSTFTYVWVELEFLTSNRSSWPQLLQQEHILILIPYDFQDVLDTLPGILKAQNIILLQKPLLWHTFAKRISTAHQRRRRDVPSRTLRFAPDVQILNEQSTSPSADTSENSTQIKKKDYTILLVEDNAINRRLGAKLLQKLSYKTLFANDGVEALTMMQKHDAEINCVLMDQSMPNMCGVTATKAIRKMEREGKIKAGRPILAVTAVVNSEAKEAFRRAGADDFLAKPLSLDRLRDVLGVYLPVD